MTKKDALWVRSMLFCRKYCGCHQMPERSFFLHGYQLPLCARCTGIVSGHIAALIAAFFITIPLPCIFLAVPLMIDGTVQYLSDYESTNTLRIITGFLYGFSVLSFVLTIVKLIMTQYIL